jgi:hypothetical protein
MAAEKAVKVEIKPVPSDREGLIGSFVTQTSDLAEKLTTTSFGIVRDVRGEISQRILGTFAFIDGSQQGFIKLLRGINDRADRLSDEFIDTVENLTLGALRTVRDTGRGVTELATSIGKSREISRAA